jgi:hypothetical protein
MKGVPNFILYLHNFLWNFSQFLAIYFELFSSWVNFTEIADMRGPPVSRRFPRRARLSARRRCVAATRPRRAIKAPTDSAVPTAPLRCPSCVVASPRARPSRLRRPPCPKLTTSLSERRASVRARHRRCPAASAVANSSTVSGAPSTPLATFSPWTVEPSVLSPLHPDAGPLPTARALTSSENAVQAEAGPTSRGPCALCTWAEPVLWTWAMRYCATGPSADSAQWHLIIFLYFLNIFNSLQIKKIV